MELTEENQNEILISVVKKDPEKDQIVHIDVEGAKEKVVVKQGTKIGEAIEKLFKFLKKPLKKFNFLYNGQYIDEKDRRKTFGHIANRIDKQQKEMHVVAYGNGMDEQLNDNEIHQNNDEAIKIEENQGKSATDEEITAYLLTNSWKFFVKLYTFLLVQFILIGVLTFLGFKYDIDDYFSKTTKSYKWTCSIITIFALICSIIPMYLSEKPKAGCCAYFLWFVYIPIITIYCFLLKRHQGEDIINGFYIVEQLIIFALDCLFVVIINAIFKKYRGLVNLLILSGINVLAIYIMVGPLSDKYDNLEMSHTGFVNISVISSIMIASIIMFNPQIVSLNKEDDETENALIAAISFNSIPFVIVFVFLVIAGLAGLTLVLYIFALFCGGLF